MELCMQKSDKNINLNLSSHESLPSSSTPSCIIVGPAPATVEPETVTFSSANLGTSAASK